MFCVSAFFLLVKLSLSEGAGFSYDHSHAAGPHAWDTITGGFCGGKEQSPIDVCGASFVPGLMLGVQDTWKNYPGATTVVNNGHTIQVNFDLANAPTTINSLADQVGRSTNAGSITWKVQQVHFHYGRSGYTLGSEGSEHFLAGKPYPLEAHFVHFNTKYADVGAAVGSGEKDALLVIGVLFSLSKTESAFMSAIGNAASTATRTAMPLQFGHNDFMDFVNANVNNDAVFSSYAGSLTTPTCNEIVTWVNMDRSCMITEATLKQFMDLSVSPARRHLRSLGATDEAHGKHGNFRPLMPNGNTVYTSSMSSLSSNKCQTSLAEAQSWYTTLKNCPNWAAYLNSECAAGRECQRDMNMDELKKTCMEINNAPACMTDPNVRDTGMLTYCKAYAMATYNWVVTSTCPQNKFWESDCGQAGSTQNAASKCWINIPGQDMWPVDDAMCTEKKPMYQNCAATQPCPRCKGCKRSGNCWKTCDNKAGMCSACDGRDGRMGACCQPGNDSDPLECMLVEWQFNAKNIHTCALLPADKHVGMMLYNVVDRLEQLDDKVEMLSKA